MTSAVPTSKQKQGYEAFALWDIEELQRDHLGRLIGPGDVLLNSATKDLEITDRGHRKIFEELRKPRDHSAFEHFTESKQYMH